MATNRATNRTRERSERWLRTLLGVKKRTRAIGVREAGSEFLVDVPDDALWSAVVFVVLLRAYEQAGIRLSNLKGVVIDAGAHTGLFSLRAAVHARHVVAIEPHPDLFRTLCANVTNSGLTNVRTVQEALWDGPGEMTLHAGIDSVSASIVGEETGGTTVATVGLDSVVEPWESVDLLKLNVEGAEFRSLGAASDSSIEKIQNIVAELHLTGHEHELTPLVERLRRLGFEVVVLDPPFYAWRTSAARVLCNWRSVRHATRTKLVACAVYTAVALARPIADVRRRVDTDSLRYLYATRNPKWSSSRRA